MRSAYIGAAAVAASVAATTIFIVQHRRPAASHQATPPVVRRTAPATIPIKPAIHAVIPPSTPTEIHLWENGAPGFEKRKNIPEKAKDWWVRRINNPSITVYLPPKEKATGAGVIIAPGGGFRLLVITEEGDEPARYLNSIGVAAFVLKYRLPEDGLFSPYRFENVRQDAYRAVRLVRSRAQEWNLDPHRVGMMGFSAGGNLISMIAYAPGEGDPNAPDPVDRLNGRPDFQIQVFGCGNVPDKLPPDSPPAFLIVANDDESGCDQAMLNQLVKLRAARVRVEAIFLAWGKHAFNMGDRTNLVTVKTWPQRMADWMQDSGYLTPAQ